MRRTTTTFVNCLLNLRTSQETAFRFLDNVGNERDSVTYCELDRRARAVAAGLQRRTRVGERALLLFPPGLEFIAAFFGCLYAGVVAVPAYPVTAKRDVPRLLNILDNAGARHVLSTEGLMQVTTSLVADAPEFSAVDWLSFEELIDSSRESDWKEPELTESSLAFLQYTSGSTGSPRGVMVSHGNLLSNEAMIRDSFRHDDRTVVVGWLPVYHDMGLIGNVLQPLYLGRPCILLSPLDFLQRPALWLEAISRYRATTSGGPNFAYDLCVRRVTEEQRAALDLGSWQLAFNGSEPIRTEVLQRFADTFAAHGFRREAFYPCYGLAEATLFVSGGAQGAPAVVSNVSRAGLERGTVTAVDAGDHDARSVVGCGHSWHDQSIRIVDPDRRTVCDEGRVGEIWVSGPNVAQGYWRQPEITAHTFHNHLDGGEGPYLRTGDLGFLRGDELFVTGRLKDVIIVRGRNHYPEDIERTAERSSRSLRPGCGAAFSVEVDGEERLIVVHEISRAFLKTIDVHAVEADIREAITANHGLRLHSAALIMPGSIPKTSSGKIQRRLCKTKYLERTLSTLQMKGQSA
jgi:acyl-CoA synthetase (AMP-forming)/AMP-acid ligase II